MANKNKNKIKPIQKMINATAASIVSAERTKVKGPKAKRARNGVKPFTAIKEAPANTSFNFTNRPATSRAVKHGLRIQHTEYVSDLISASSSSTYKEQFFNINPSNASLFPWLSVQAQSYSSFVPHSIKFHIKSVVGTSISGTAFITSTPDCDDSLPGGKAAFLQLENVTRCNVWEQCTHVLPSDITKRLPVYLNSTATTSVTDTTRELGQLFVGSDGIAASNTVYGELYVTYDISLLHAQPQTGFSSWTNHITGASPTIPFGTAISPINANIGTSLENNGISSAGVCLKVLRQGAYNITIINSLASGNTFTTLPVYICADDMGTIITTTVLFQGYAPLNCVMVNSTNHVCVITILNVVSTTNPFYLLTSTLPAASDGTTFQTQVMINPTKATSGSNLTSVLDILTSRLAALESKLGRSEPESDSELLDAVPNMSSSFYQRVGEAVLKATKP
jgi:hypothetical protein